MPRLLSAFAVAAVTAWCLLSLVRPWTCAYVPRLWPHKIAGAAALAGVFGLLVLARRRPGLAVMIALAAVALAAADLVRRWHPAFTPTDVATRFLAGTAAPLVTGALLIVACVGWGGVVRRLARRDTLGLGERLALGILAQALLLFLAGSTGLLHPALAWALVGIGGIAGLLDLRRDLPALRAFTPPAPEQILWIAPAVLTVLFGTVRALAPEIDGDSLRYHLALPRRYASSGSMGFYPENAFSLMPAYGQMMHLESLLLGSDSPSRLLGVAAFVAAVRSVFLWARRYDGDRMPWIAAGLFGAVVQWRETVGTAMTETFLVLFAALSLQHLARTLEESDASKGSLLLAGVFAGGVAGCKLFGILFPTFLAAGLVLTARVRWKDALVLGVLGTLLASPWYVRSAIHSGNPFWPSFAPLFGGHEPLVAQNRLLLEELRRDYGVPLSPLALPLFPFYATIHGARYDVALDPWILAWLPAVAFLRRPVVLNAGLWMSLGTAAVVAAIYVPLTRFFAALFPALALAVAWAMKDPPAPWMRKAVTASFVAYATATAATHLPAVETALLPVLGFQSREHHPRSWIKAYAVSRHASRVLPADAKVLVVGFTDTYYLDREVHWTDPTIQHEVVVSRFRDAEEILAHLDRRGIGTIVAPGADPFPELPGRRDRLRLLHQEDGWSLFALDRAR